MRKINVILLIGHFLSSSHKCNKNNLYIASGGIGCYLQDLIDKDLSLSDKWINDAKAIEKIIEKRVGLENLNNF